VSKHKFKNGHLVVLDPTGKKCHPVGKVTGEVTFLDNALAYFVSVADPYNNMVITRHLVTEDEIHAVEVATL
jgi:hypothetical protein